MSRIGLLVVTLVVGAAACSSDTDGSGSSSGGGSCADITGNYSVTVERISGTCDPALDPKTSSVGIAKADDGSYLIVLPGIEGGCPATLDGSCKLTSACEAKNAQGVVVANSNISYTFTSAGFTGTSLGGLRPPAVASTCDVTYRETGTKL